MRKLILYLAGILYGLVVTGWLAPVLRHDVADRPETSAAPAPVTNTPRAWFQAAKPYCNPVEVDTRLRARPAPEGEVGVAYEAACLAVAGRIDRARARIESLPQAERWRAAGVVFDVAHPAADAGDDLAAGPVMELVAEFWPNHYMALYHAGAANFERGEEANARTYLERFLDHSTAEDGWRANAHTMLEALPRER